MSNKQLAFEKLCEPHSMKMDIYSKTDINIETTHCFRCVEKAITHSVAFIRLSYRTFAVSFIKAKLYCKVCNKQEDDYIGLYCFNCNFEEIGYILRF